MASISHINGFLSLVFGLIFGSFANVLIYRLPRSISIVKPGSFCPQCHTPVNYYDNIPLISYLILRGRCRKCKAKILFRYPLVEGLMGVVFLSLYLEFGISFKALFYTAFVFIMIVHSFIDLEHYLLLDKLNISGGIIGLIFRLFSPDFPLLEGIFGLLMGGGLLALVYVSSLLLFKKEGMGMGDIKTGAVCGLFLGPVLVIYLLLMASIIGIFWALFKVIGKRGKRVPFGVLMGFASVLIIFLREEIYRYLSF